MCIPYLLVSYLAPGQGPELSCCRLHRLLPPLRCLALLRSHNGSSTSRCGRRGPRTGFKLRCSQQYLLESSCSARHSALRSSRAGATCWTQLSSVASAAV